MKFKRFLCYFLATLLTVFVVSSANYKSVHAFEWVSGALSFAEAMTWVLASLGITTVVGDYTSEVDMSRQEFWQSYERDFYTYVEDHEGNTASDRFIEWKNKFCSGVIDKSSEYWDLFREWAYNLVSGSSDASVPQIGDNAVSYFNYFKNTYNMNMSSSLTSTAPVRSFIIFRYNDGDVLAFFETDNNRVLHTQSRSGQVSISEGSLYCIHGDYDYNIWRSGRYNYFNNTFSCGWLNLSSFDQIFVGGNVVVDSTTLASGKVENLGGTTADEHFQSATGVNENTDIVSRIGEEEDEEVKIKYPGLEDSDDGVSEDIYDNIINEVNEGTKTIDDAIEEIQGILGVIAYDDVTDDVVPNEPDPDTGGNKKKEEVLKENKDNMTFTLAGLENIFPFCIPWDIYSFITILEAEPDAPEFDFPIKSVNNHTENIHVDLSPFEPVAVVVRYIFDFLFIIGLALLTRSLIGAGGSD